MNREKPQTGSSISLQERSCSYHCLFIHLLEICARGKREAICQSRSQLTETIDPPFYCAGEVHPYLVRIWKNISEGLLLRSGLIPDIVGPVLGTERGSPSVRPTNFAKSGGTNSICAR